MKAKKEAGHAHEIENPNEVIEVGLDAITEFLRSMEDAAEGHVFPVAIRSILAAVTRVVRERHPELPQFVVSKDQSSRYLSRSRLGPGEFRSEILQAVHLARGAIRQEKHRDRDNIEPDSAGA